MMNPVRHATKRPSTLLAGTPHRQTGRIHWTAAAAAVAVTLAGAWWWRGHVGTDQAQAAQPASSGASGVSGPGGRRGPAGGGRRGGGPATVSVATVTHKDVSVTVETVGTFTAANTAVVRPQVSGVLQKLLVKEGQTVKAGQAIAQIDPRAFEATLAQADGALARDQATLDNARIDLRRYQDLLAKEAVPRQQFETQQATVRQLEGTVKLDQASVASARLQLSYTRVTAPIGGRVGLKQADVGNIVQPSDANGIVSIVQSQPIALVMAVPAANLAAMQTRLQHSEPLRVVATDRASGQALARGKVSVLDNAIDLGTDTIKVKALFPNEDGSLFPNQAVSASLQVNLLPNALVVPDGALSRGTRGMQVYVVDEGFNVLTRPVRALASDGGWTAVEGDLHDGERVVIDGLDRLREGDQVQVADAKGHDDQQGGKREGHGDGEHRHKRP